MTATYSPSRRAPPIQAVQTAMSSRPSGGMSLWTTMSAGLQDPERLPEHGGLVQRQVDDAVGDDEVGERVLEGQRLCVPLAVLDLPGASERDVLAAALEHRRRHVQGDDPAAGSDGPCGEEAVHPAAGPDVDHRL